MDSKILKEIGVTVVIIAVLMLAVNWVTGENFISVYTGLGIAIGIAIGLFIKSKLGKK